MMANLAAWAALPIAAAVGTALTATPDVMRVVAGQSQIVDAPDVTQIALGDGRIADVKVLARNGQIMVTGLQSGMTTLSLWHRDGSKVDVLLRVMDSDPRAIADDLGEILRGVPGVVVRVVGQRVMLEGQVLNAADFAKIEAAHKLYPDVLNFVRPNTIDLDQMVRLDVLLIEIDHSAATRIGVSWPDAIGADANVELEGGLVPGVGPFAGSIALTSSLGAAVQLFQQSGSARILSHPSLVTKNGSKASFHAGGSIPVPVQSTLGQPTVEWKDFGIRLEITPRVDRAENFHLDLQVEVSDLDFANAVESSGGTLPALRSRATSSIVNLARGESLVLAELVDRRQGKAVGRVPGLGSVPILGELFRTRALDDRESEIYLVATPAVVRPGALGDDATMAPRRRYSDAEPEVTPRWRE